MDRPRQMAADAYHEITADVGSLLDLIGEEMRLHAEAGNPSWGRVGDAAGVREGLLAVLASMLLDRHGSEAATVEWIEDHLAEMRS